MEKITWIADAPETTLSGWYRVAYETSGYFDKAMFDTFEDALQWIAEVKATI